MGAVHAPSSEYAIPVPRTPLVGRERERADVLALLGRADVPLVTLTGPGGMGKTRLALQIAADSTDEFGGNIQFVPLAPIRDPDLVLPAIAQAVGLVALNGQSPSVGLLKFFTGRQFLLVIDNLEQVIAVADELFDLLAHCPGLTMLVTSREPLRISGEHEYPVPPLSLPPHGSSMEGVMRSESAQLFVQRAQAVRPDFVITPSSTASIVDICNRLDGLPLAIELAASRIKILSPQAIQSRLVDRLALLSRGGRDMPDRLRTMRHAVGWSYDLLTDDERRLFRRLAVFAGGCTIEMAESLSDMLDGEQSADIFDGLSSLLDKSLLVLDDRAPGEPRFHMLETIRAYALEQLIAHGEERAARAALATWLTSRMAPFFDVEWGPAQRQWTDFFDAEANNIRAVLGWYLDQGDVDGASWMTANVVTHWHTRGQLAEGWSWAERALALGDAIGPGTKRARLELGSGWILFHLGEPDRARDILNHARARAEAGNDLVVANKCRHVLGYIDSASGHFDQAVTSFEAAFDFYSDRGDRTWQGIALVSLGQANFEQGHIELAETHVAEAIAMFREDGNTFGLGIALAYRAEIARTRGDLAGARRLFKESIGYRWEHGDRYGLVGCLAGLGQVEVLMGRHDEAVRLFGATEELRESIGAEFPVLHSRHSAFVSTAEAQLGAKQFAAAWQQGRNTPIGDIVARAVRVDDIDELERSGDRSERPFGLTAREIEVLRLICEGRSNRAIAEELFVTKRTAQTHVQHIFDKMGVGTRAAAAARAVELHLL
jgi:non-specific serine/threonine protein kinase